MRGLLKILILTGFLFCCTGNTHAQWVQQNNPSDFYLYDIFFLNNNTGWTSGISVLKTTNGGTNWENLGTPYENSGLNDIHFFDANTGFLCGYGFYKTTNGGNNWTNTGLPLAVYRQVSFANAATGWVVRIAGAVSKTTDGGNNWTDIFYTGDLLESVNFINTNTGWIAGSGGAVYKTTNGGTNWTLQSTGTSNNLKDIKFSDANNGRACGENQTYIRTTNGGANWVSVSGPFGNNYSRLLFINSTTGWMTGTTGIAFTTNNGSSWVNQTPFGAGAFFYGMHYISPNTIYTTAFTPWKSSTGGFNLNAPSNLTLTAVSTSQINLSWTDNSSDEEKFIIERSTDGNNWSTIDSVNASVTSYQSTGLSTDQLYYYRVYGKKIIFTSGYSTTEWIRTPMTAPTLSSPEAGTVIPYVPVLQWTTAPNAFTYTLQVASDTNFTNIVYTIISPALTSSPVPPANLQNSTRYYWRVRVSSFTNQSLFTPYRDFVFQNPHYGNNMSSGNNLYYFANSTSGANLSPSKPTYNWRDTTGSTSLIVNGVYAPISAGTQQNARFDLIGKLPAGHSIKFFGTNYQDLYIGTNGIIAFNSFVPNFAPNMSPVSGLPQSNILQAIFPCWKNFNFAAPAVTGSRLCYKITSNEIIITYMRAPSSMDPDYYVSFQVIISHSASPAANSAITIQYNYSETGSTFISRYNDNTLGYYLIGLQGANAAAQCYQYRYLNLSQVVSSGPMFGSDLAVQFGPDAALLPVELSSFTSHVNGNSVKLNWSTVSEQNNSGFEIQRTITNENNWKKISFVNGNGTTNEAKNYSYEDRNISSGKYQYRLKQIDFNGNYEFHALANEVEIGVPKKFSLSQNYPNPFNPATKINFELPRSSNVKLSVYDVTGKLASELVNEQRAAGHYTVEFNASNLASGMYFYRIEAGEFSAAKKMMLVK